MSRLLVLITVLFITACEPAKTAQPAKPKTVLVTEVVAGNQANNLSFAGKLQATDRASLSFEASGLIASLNVDLGDTFKQGDVLGRLNDVQAGLNLKARKADRLTAEASLNDAELEYGRKLKLIETNVISQDELDHAKNKVTSSKAQLAAAESAVETAQKQLKDTVLVAPFAGEVAARLVEPSQQINRGQAIFDVIGDNKALEGVIFVPETVKQSLNLGDSAQLRVLPLNKVIPGQITEIGNRANSAGLYTITLETRGDTENVSPGQSIDVTVNTADNSHTQIYIPITAYGLTPNGDAYTYILNNDDNTVVLTEIVLGEISATGVQVISGLQSGNTVIIKGVDLLSNGQQVNPVADTLKRFGS